MEDLLKDEIINLSETIEKYTNEYTITFGEIMEKLSHEYTIDKNVQECQVCIAVEEIIEELLKKKLIKKRK